MKSYKIGIDTGGTYTDAVVYNLQKKQVMQNFQIRHHDMLLLVFMLPN